MLQVESLSIEAVYVAPEADINGESETVSLVEVDESEKVNDGDSTGELTK